MAQPRVITRRVRYCEDASALFAQLGGLEATDSILMESADITTASGIQSVAVLAASLRVTCNGDRVDVVTLTESGKHFAADLDSQLAGYKNGEASYVFPRSTAEDERERLTAPSNVEALRALTTRADYTDETGMLPMLAGGFAFDFLETYEMLPDVVEGPNTYPDYQFMLAEIVLRMDHQNQTATLTGVDAAGGEVERRIEEIAAQIENPQPWVDRIGDGGQLTVTADITDADFKGHIEDLKNEIYAGEIYQVVPARSFQTECTDPFEAYRQLRETNPSPYMFYVRGLDRADKPYELFGASPESSLKFDHVSREVQLYPIAGTRPRGFAADGSISPELDVRRELELRTNAKEVAEHTMLVDLARNDMARVSMPGTRKVAELLQVDRYSRVMHLVSRVTATLADDLDALDAYRACMNMGTLTGAPKLRATELLRDVEKHRRGSYGGAVGYLRGNEDMDTCIVIRSAYVSGGQASVQAGMGVVRDSDPQAEADESLHKAYAVLHAIALAAGAELKVVR